MALETHDVTSGDTLTPMGCQLKQRNAAGTLAAVNLTGLTVKFTLVKEDGTVVVDEDEAGVTVTDATNGKVEYDFPGTAVVDAGDYYGWFTVYFGGERDTYPQKGRRFKIVISELG